MPTKLKIFVKIRLKFFFDRILNHICFNIYNLDFQFCIRFDQFVVSVVEEHLNYEESRGKAVHERVTETIDRYVQWQKSQQTLKTLGTGDEDAKQQCDAILGEMRAAQVDLDTVSQDREKMNLLKGDTWPTPEAESRWNALAAQLKTTADALGQYKDLYTIKKEPTATSDIDMVNFLQILIDFSKFDVKMSEICSKFTIFMKIPPKKQFRF